MEHHLLGSQNSGTRDGIRHSVVRDPILEHINSPEGKAKALVIPCLQAMTMLEMVIGVLMVLFQVVVSALIWTTKPITNAYSMDQGFPGLTAGISVIVFGFVSRKEIHRAKMVAMTSQAEHVGCAYILWNGQKHLSRIFLGMAVIAIAFLLTSMACTVVGLLESTTLLQIAPTDDVSYIPTVTVIAAMQAFLVVPLGVLAVIWWLQTVIASMMIGDICCKFCYPVPIFTDWEKKYIPFVISKSATDSIRQLSAEAKV